MIPRRRSVRTSKSAPCALAVKPVRALNATARFGTGKRAGAESADRKLVEK